MNLLKIHHQPWYFSIFQTTFPLFVPSPPHFLSLQISPILREPKHSITVNSFSNSTLSSFPPISLSKPKPKPKPKHLRVSATEASVWSNEEENISVSRDLEDLALDGAVFQNTLRLVECSMFAAVSGLAYLLSNSLAIENYFGCFFSLPIVISSMRWGVAAGRKTMVATATLLLVLSGPVKALTYLLMYGLDGFTMGSLWRLGANCGLSIFLCSFVRAMGAMGYVLITSFLIRENILALITINIHASLTYMSTAIGINTIPSMGVIYAIFGTALLLNCGFCMFLLHILYAVFFPRLGMKASLALPRWLEKAI